jgi:hypothetical protein
MKLLVFVTAYLLSMCSALALSSPAKSNSILDGLQDPKLAKRAISLKYSLYTITLTGTAVNNYQAFSITGELMITNGITKTGVTNGLNPSDIIVSVGRPASNPIAGSIW